MTQDLIGKSFLLFGGSGGIGRVVVKRLTARGAAVSVAGRSAQSLESIATETGARTFPVDVTQPEAVREVFESVKNLSGDLHGVAHLVGSIILKPAHLTSESDWQSTIALNLTSAFYVLKNAVQYFGPAGGALVLMSSAAARIGLASHEAIAAAKAGVEGLALSAAASYAARGIRINCVAPGLVRTPLAQKITGNPTAEKASISMHPLRRLGEPEDVARVVELLLDPQNSWITGQVFGIDGGLGTLKVRNDG